MTKEELKTVITSILPSVTFPEINSPLLNFSCTPAELRSVAHALRDNDQLKFDFLYSLTALDWPTYLEVIYHLRSSTLGNDAVLRVKTEGRENVSVPTVSSIWSTAEFHEREVFDLFGIKFDGHPDLRRIFLEDDWVGYPLRKDYQDEINIVEL